MLKCYVCVACERIIFEQPVDPQVPSAVGNATLVNLFRKVTASGPPDKEIPKDAVVPNQWAIYSAWDSEADDEKKSYFLCTQILYPDQSPFGQTTRMLIPVRPNDRSQMAIRVSGFPIGQTGFYTVRNWVEENGEIVVPPIEFKIELEIQRSTQTNG